MDIIVFIVLICLKISIIIHVFMDGVSISFSFFMCKKSLKKQKKGRESK